VLTSSPGGADSASWTATTCAGRLALRVRGRAVGAAAHRLLAALAKRAGELHRITQKHLSEGVDDQQNRPGGMTEAPQLGDKQELGRLGQWLGRVRASLASWSLGLLSLSFAASGAVLILGKDDATARSRLYTGTPQFKVWATLIIGVIAALPAVWRVGVDLLRRLGRDPRRVLLSWAAPALCGIVLVVTAAILAGQYARGSGSPYYDGAARIGAIYLIAVTAALPAFLAMWECYRQLGTDQRSPGQHPDTQFAKLLRLRECLLSALTTVGMLVSAGVLATGAERQAALAEPKYTAPYPAAYVLIWGIAFSAVLVVNFLPAFRRLTRVANTMIDATLPLLLPGADRWQERLQERKDLAELLKVTSGAKDVITSAILVAGPLISSGFSLFLPGR
jgi:hypothetical protein